MIMGFMDNLRAALRPRGHKELELEYLNEATSRVDLELRQRDIDRGRFRQLPRHY